MHFSEHWTCTSTCTQVKAAPQHANADLLLDTSSAWLVLQAGDRCQTASAISGHVLHAIADTKQFMT